MRGRLVRRLHGGPLPKGVTMLSWDGTDDRGNALPSGQYVMRLEAGKTSVSRKVTLAR
jgi:flagellar hook assembly protein FlgD